jgi:spectrin beta
MAEAEQMLNEHKAIKEEIEAYAPDYAKMKEFGDKVVEGQEDVQYMFLREVCFVFMMLSISYPTVHRD